MRIGIVAEFNPLHSGHEYLIKEARKILAEGARKSGEFEKISASVADEIGENLSELEKTSANVENDAEKNLSELEKTSASVASDTEKSLNETAEGLQSLGKNKGSIICVMSEFFTQRGEVAVVDGYKRAREAVRAGCDLVIALPYLGSVAYSDDFAKKSIEILAGAGVTHLIFGTENVDVTLFEEIYEKQRRTTEAEYKNLLKKGYSFAKINNELFGLKQDNPNFTLAYSYYKALRELAPHIKLLPIKREGQSLNAENIEQKKHLSATAIRKNLESSEVETYLAKSMLETLRMSKTLSEEDFFELLRYKITSLDRSGLRDIYDISEGLENRIYEANLVATSYRDLVEKIATKRYSNKKIQRVLLHILTNTKKIDYEKYFKTKVFRVLALNKERGGLIREINKKGEITLVPNLNSKNSMHFVHDIKVARIYNLVAQDEDIFAKKVERV